MKVVFDTAALVTAIRSGGGAAAEVVRLIALGKVTILLDFKLVCEYRDVVMRPHHIAASGKRSEDAEAVIAMLEAVATPVLVVIKHRPLCRDVNDDMVMDVAINGHAEAIVTNNVRHFVAAAARFAIPVLTPKGFLAAVKEGRFRT